MYGVTTSNKIWHYIRYFFFLKSPKSEGGSKTGEDLVDIKQQLGRIIAFALQKSLVVRVVPLKRNFRST